MSEAMAPELTTSHRFDFGVLACVLGLVVVQQWNTILHAFWWPFARALSLQCLQFMSA